MVMEFTGPG